MKSMSCENQWTSDRRDRIDNGIRMQAELQVQMLGSVGGSVGAMRGAGRAGHGRG
jgi:hypothetical protein